MGVPFDFTFRSVIFLKNLMKKDDLAVRYLPVSELKPSTYNPRRWDESAIQQLTDSVRKFGMVDPILCNNAPGRENIIIGGHFRLKVAKDLGIKEVPVVFVNIPEIERERELNLRLNRNLGAWNLDLLAEFDPALLTEVGFSSEEMDEITGIDETPEVFNLKKELDKLGITDIDIQKGDLWKLGNHYLACGDSTDEAHITGLVCEAPPVLCLTDPPYILDYLRGKKKNGKPTEGFGFKRDRKYLETDELPDNFTELWMANIAKVASPNFSILCYENWKNIPTIWGEMAKHWKVKNMIVWHTPNRNQGFAAKYKFFSKHDIAMVGQGGEPVMNLEPEDELLQNEYETALFAIQGKPQWEGYEKGKKYQPTDFIEFNVADEKSSGQGIIFGVKPIEILIPYIKVLTKRGDWVIEPFGGSGSTLIACEKLGRNCYISEKSPTYACVIRNRWEKLTGQKGVKVR
jgi:DNA modification methylase